MASDLEQAKGSRNRYEGVIESQLARAEGRIRGIDCTSGILAVVALTLAYGLLAGLCDRLFTLSGSIRLFAFLAYLSGAGFLLWRLVFLPLTRQINPLYAALKVEKTLPGAKNSVVNWLDLHDQPLAASIRSALGQRAAKDLGQADVEAAVTNRHAGWLGVLVAGTLIGLLGLFFWSGPSPFFSLMRRAYAPFNFGSDGIATRTTLEIITPEGGDATVNLRKPVKIAVQTDGREPESVTLEYRYHEKDRFMTRPFQVDGSRTWTTTIPAEDVQNGFFYRVKGGDATTPTYQIRTRPNPVIERVQSFYHYRDYVGLAYVGQWPTVSAYRPLEAWRGTRVIVEATTNRRLKEGRLEFRAQADQETTIVAVKPLADRDQSFQAELILDRPGTYQLSFTSIDGEVFTETQSFAVTPVEDLPPVVEITAPLQDIRLPSNGILKVDGKARDDIGVKAIILHLRNVDKDEPELEGKIYQPEGGLDLASGGNPQAIAYKDFIELATLKTQAGKPYPLRTGIELECWLSARDACDYPDAKSFHVAESKRFLVRILDPEADNEQKKEKDQAKQQQQRHEEKQKEDLKKENQERQERQQDAAKKEEQKQGEGDQKKPQNADQQNGDKKPNQGEKQPGDQQEKDQSQPNEKGGQEPKPEGGKDPKAEPKKDGSEPKDGQQKSEQTASNTPSPEQQRKDEETKQKAQQLKDALDKKQQQEQKQGDPGEGKGEKPQPAQSKGDPKAEQKSQPNKDNTQSKPEPQKDNPAQPGQEKASNKDERNQQPPGEKNAAQPGTEKGPTKDEKNQPAPGEKKDGSQQKAGEPKPPPGEQKGNGTEANNAQKNGGQPDKGEPKPSGAAKQEGAPPAPSSKSEPGAPNSKPQKEDSAKGANDTKSGERANAGAGQPDPKEAKPQDAKEAAQSRQ